MTRQNAKTKEITLGDDFGDVTVKANGTAVVIHDDGVVEHYPILRAINRQRSSNDDGKANQSTTPSSVVDPADPGETAKDGWYYAGLSEDPSSPKYHQPLWVAPHDAGIMTWNEADKTAAKLREKGGEARLPTRGELNQIFNALAKKDIGGFNRTGSDPAGFYWAAEHFNFTAACQQFSAGDPGNSLRGSRSSARFVR